MAATAPRVSGPPATVPAPAPLPSTTAAVLDLTQTPASAPGGISADSWLATATTARADLTLPSPWMHTTGGSWLAVLDSTHQLSSLYASCASLLPELAHISFRRVSAVQDNSASSKVRCVQELVSLVRSMDKGSVSALFTPDVAKTSVALCRLRESRDKTSVAGLDFVVLGSEDKSKKYEQVISIDGVPDVLLKHCPVWPAFASSKITVMGEYAPPAHLNRWRLDSKFPMVYLALIHCWDGIVRVRSPRTRLTPRPLCRAFSSD